MSPPDDLPGDLLADVLAGRVPPAAHLWDPAYDVAALRATVERAGWRFLHLDASPDPTRAGTLEALGEVLALPRWWGRNLDALADSLRDVAADPAGDRTVLLWDGWAALAADNPRTLDVVLRLLTGAGLTVLLSGPLSTGPGPSDR
ncbi:barstar family protein [Nocardioides abyssi]|uniref:Barstar family protein n=1 Tax=Nocardioides abyssi TaxID=3058370 RepID=A0ABT8EYJ6_9ACTN|nr:barstar family protein [Nocardioides abyssi]MDN4163208.1 barstar family protein [Nocardioides abyssi]